MIKRKITLTFILTFILVGGIIFLSFHYETKEPTETKNSLLSIMLEDEEGKYVKAKENTWSEEYILNEEKSYCTNNSKLSYNEETKKVSVTTKGSEKCWLYFDKEITGTEDNPYKIATIEDLVNLSNEVNKGNNYAGKYIILTKDLDFKNREDYENPDRIDYGNINGVNGIETLYNELNNSNGSGFMPIGNNNNNTFQGIFEGKRYKISNLFINQNQSIAVGLFGAIKNSTIKDLTVTGNVTSQIANNVGGLVGSSLGKSTIENCHNEATLTINLGSYSIGGIIGANDASNLTIINCTNKGSINNGNNTGGIIGYNGGTLVVNNSINYGAIVNNKGMHAGGILGRDDANNNFTEITNSHNEGKVISNVQEEEKETYTGGLIGKISGKIDIDNSYNTGEVRNERSNYSKSINLAIGGLLGYLTNSGPQSTIVNSYNNGDLFGATKVGGIVGYIASRTSETIIDKCYNIGNITSNIIAGNNNTTLSGLVGYTNNSKTYILNSYNLGNITSAKISAGIGFVDFGGILYAINTYNIGNMVENMAASGLFISGENENPSIFGYNSYNIGKVEATRIGGIYAQQWNNNIQHMKTINNVYYENSVSASNVAGVEGTPMAMTAMKSQNFVDTLNNNLATINLGTTLKEIVTSGLVGWKLGSDNIPTFDEEKVYFPFTGNYQEFEVPEKGNYQIELWGAQGGSADANSIGGKGAYTSGIINLEKDEKLYVYVGENNNTVNGYCANNTSGSFNGTKDAVCSIGGGATDVRLIGDEWDNFDSLKSRIMVAAGGGSAYYPGHGGAGGALNGIDGEGTGADSSFYAGKGATQTSYNFGVAKNYTCNPGNGYYSGQAGSGGNGGGGSSFISGYPGCNAIDAKSTSSNIIATNQPVHYSGKKFSASSMIAGDSVMPSPNGGTETGHTGNGYAKISLVKNDIPD